MAILWSKQGFWRFEVADDVGVQATLLDGTWGCEKLDANELQNAEILEGSVFCTGRRSKAESRPCGTGETQKDRDDEMEERERTGGDRKAQYVCKGALLLVEGTIIDFSHLVH
jgi:hypothetical protein